MNRASIAATVLGMFLVACAAGVFEPSPLPGPVSPLLRIGPIAAGDGGVIAGVVQEHRHGGRIARALVILQCTCLDGRREATTDSDGAYRFEALPPGKYTVQVLYDQANVAKSCDLPADSGMRMNFAIDPDERFIIEVG